MSVQPGTFFRSGDARAVYQERFTAASARLQWLSCGEYELQAGAAVQEVAWPGQEALLFAWLGGACVTLASCSYALAPYDILYVPRGRAHAISNPGPESARLFVCRAPADSDHPVHHAQFAALAGQESRLRRLKSKNVYLIFDVGEAADKLVAGYTFFEAHARSWPPHNHTDQEEVYIFLKGRGSMEVYESPENLTFVREVREGDMVTIPFLNYHPVFSQDEPLEFIWCIAGARYWVGDRNKDFVRGTADAITT